MSAPSLVASPAGPAQYVSAVLHPAALWEIVQRDGVDETRRRLIDVDHGWTYLDADQRGRLHPSCQGDRRFGAVAGYGVANHTLRPVGDWTDAHATTPLSAVFVLGAPAIRVYAPGLALAIPYADPSPNWSCFEHAALGGPPPRVQLVEVRDHPSRRRQ